MAWLNSKVKSSGTKNWLTRTDWYAGVTQKKNTSETVEKVEDSQDSVEEAVKDTPVEITSVLDVNFDYDGNTAGVDIDGYLFFPREVSGDVTHSHREFLRTKIMSGGEFVSRGQYVPREYVFDDIIDIDPNQLDDYYNLFTAMQNRICTITSPYMGGMFKGEVSIQVTNPETSPHVIEIEIHIKEIPDIMARLKGDPAIKYPSTTTVSDISIREVQTTESSSKTNEQGHKDIYRSYYGKGYDLK